MFCGCRLHILIFVEVSLLQRFGLRLGVGIVTTTVLTAHGRCASAPLQLSGIVKLFLVQHSLSAKPISRYLKVQPKPKLPRTREILAGRSTKKAAGQITIRLRQIHTV